MPGARVRGAGVPGPAVRVPAPRPRVWGPIERCPALSDHKELFSGRSKCQVFSDHITCAYSLRESENHRQAKTE